MLFYSSSATPASVAGARGSLKEMAEWTGLDPATPGVTGRYSNQLNYHSACWWVLRGSNPRPSPCKGDALPAELSTLWKRRGSLPREYGVVQCWRILEDLVRPRLTLHAARLAPAFLSGDGLRRFRLHHRHGQRHR